jgi:quercetin dioxygenase-like cupin family protein
MHTTTRLTWCLLVAGSAMAVACAATAGSSSRPPAEEETSAQPTESVFPLLERQLPNVPGESLTSVIVDFPPGARAVPHRHGDAFVYAYVLDGSVRSRLAGSPAHTYYEGQDWVENPGAHHLLTENTSRTETARLLVVFVDDTGAELKVDDPPGRAFTH